MRTLYAKNNYIGKSLTALSTPEGQALIQKHGILSSHGILINDEFFAMDGATEKQLREKFEILKQK